MRRIGVLTGGGDAPGMNAAIRAVVRSAINRKVQVVGIMRGFAGLIEGEMRDLDSRSVGGIIHQGGTILRTKRCPEFKTKEGMSKAVENIKRNRVDGLAIIGGNGSFHGAREFSIDWHIPTIAVPATIDNDITGTDFSIGFDSAVNIALEAISKIRDTATSHERLFIIEVMGRDSGFIALQVGLAGGAESIIIPEVEYDLDRICDKLKERKKIGKLSNIIIVAEGAGKASQIRDQIGQKCDMDIRITVLGHVQRGGPPTAFDAVLASRLGAAAANLLIEGHSTKMVGLVANKIEASSIVDPKDYAKRLDLDLYRLVQVLAT